MIYPAFSLMPFFGIIQVTGSDRASFLHNQFSNDINHLEKGQACLATYNTAKGRVIANLVLLNRGEDLLIIAARDLCSTIIKKLQMYILRSKVTLTLQTDISVAVATPSQSNSYQWPAQPILKFSAQQIHENWLIPLPDQSYLQIGKTENLPTFDSDLCRLWQQYEIQIGNPWISQSTTETCVAQMLNQQLIGAINFKKGCYPGQEIIARAQYRGQVKRGLALLKTTESLQDGELIYNQENEEVGLIINQVRLNEETLALAVIKHTAATEKLHSQLNQNLTVEHCFFSCQDDTIDK